MTINIANICESNNHTILCADRMLTVNLPNIEFEHGTCKLHKITENCAVAVAGNALAYSELFDAVKIVLQQHPTDSIPQIVNHITNTYKMARMKKMEELILLPAGLNLNEYKQMQQALSPVILQPIFQKMVTYDFGLVLVVAGVDANGGHIYKILSPGTTQCYNSIGYLASGSGEHHSLASLIENNCQNTLSLKDALIYTYEAKKRAEKATGVGESTDIWIISKDKIITLEDEKIKLLNKIYEGKKRY